MYRGTAPLNDLEENDNTQFQAMYTPGGGQMYYGFPNQSMFYDYPPQYQVPLAQPVHSNLSGMYSTCSPQLIVPPYGGSVETGIHGYHDPRYQTVHRTDIGRSMSDHNNGYNRQKGFGIGQYGVAVAGPMSDNLMSIPGSYAAPPMNPNVMMPYMAAQTDAFHTGSRQRQPEKLISPEQAPPKQIFSALPAQPLTVAKSKHSKKGRKASKNSPATETKSASMRPRWSPDEEKRFVTGLSFYGKKWDRIKRLVETRSLSQIISHAQNIFKKQGLKIKDIEQADIDLYLAKANLNP